jgi:RHH-type proline utilization regulon transcriptional repressor/proline dehydrogenase/delta 1-pyrroline-5-carboxylate dehydrogenase
VIFKKAEVGSTVNFVNVTDPLIDSLAFDSCAKARQLIVDAERLRTRHERANRRRFARLLRDHVAIEVTMTLTDEVMRVNSLASAAVILRATARRASVAGFGAINATGLRLVALMSRLTPSLAVKLTHWRIRGQSQDLILAAEAPSLRRHLEDRQRKGMSLNINVLGEAVLGEGEASERLRRVLEIMHRDEVTYISVKLSAIVSQITTIDREGSLARIVEKLRILYQAAERDGVFVNLDMEEYRDLRLTVDGFQSVLSEPEFIGISAGIVLQAYLPESHAALEDLIAWAKVRFESRAGSIKIRLVKGANLAMEHTEAQIHGWTPAPYGSKADVDASYARLLDISLRPSHSDAVRVGVASHNLFDLSWAVEVARARGVLEQLDIEMLEGMANSEALAIVKSGHRVLLYAPVTRHDDFPAAVAYLVRRLDENTSDENYLKAAFYIARDPEVFDEQQQRFLDSVEHRHHVVTRSRRHAPNSTHRAGHFKNAVDGDPTNPEYVRDVANAIKNVRAEPIRQIPLVIDREDVFGDEIEDGRDPSNNGAVWYRYSVATMEQIDSAVAHGVSAVNRWASLSSFMRRAILQRSAEIMESHRATTIGVMARDAGKTVSEADPEVSEAIDFARFYSSEHQDFTGSTPLGVVLVVPPWNFPYAIPAGGVCAALAAGNSVILKPAPETVATAYELAKHLWAGGVPRDVLQFVPTRDDDSGRHLVTNPGVGGVILTGSFDTARLFTSWKPDINLLAETSGKNAILISSYADIDLAVKDLVQSAFGHAGQKCSAASLAIVDKTIYEDPAFFRQLSDAVESLQVGRGYDLATTVGPIIRTAEPALARALNHLEPGESWLVQPKACDEAKLQWRPGVKIGVKPGSWSHQNEWFGPVLAVMPAPDFATALQWQNDVPFGLTAGLHSLDESQCQYWIDHVEAGNVYLNRGTTGAVVNRQPFGGWKRSSVGPTAKAGGRNYVNCLRNWPRVTNVDSALEELKSWWDCAGGRARDESGLSVEANVQRYRQALAPIAVRIDESLTDAEATLVGKIASITGARIVLSSEVEMQSVRNVTRESLDELVARSANIGKVRWLSKEPPPVGELLDYGVSIDRRPLAQAGAIEGPRWLLEQSVAMTRHRYGNVNAGPKPVCQGLAENVDVIYEEE